MWRGLQLALAAVLLAAAPASASTGSISDVVPVTDGIFTATFRASSDNCDAGGGCGWISFATTDSAAGTCDPGGPRIYTSGTHTTPGSDEAAGVAFYPDTEGSFRLCLYVSHGDAIETVAEFVYTPPAPVVTPRERLMRRDAEYATRSYLGQRYGAWPGRVRRLQVACRRLDAWSFRCRVSWRSDAGRYRGTIKVRAVSGSDLRVRASVRKRG